MNECALGRMREVTPAGFWVDFDAENDRVMVFHGVSPRFAVVAYYGICDEASDERLELAVQAGVSAIEIEVAK